MDVFRHVPGAIVFGGAQWFSSQSLPQYGRGPNAPAELRAAAAAAAAAAQAGFAIDSVDGKPTKTLSLSEVRVLLLVRLTLDPLDQSIFTFPPARLPTRPPLGISSPATIEVP